MSKNKPSSRRTNAIKKIHQRKEKCNTNDYIVFLQEHEDDTGLMEDDSINFRQVMKSSNSQEWIDAINEEIKFMNDNDIWDLVPLPKGAKPIGCK